MDSPENIKPSEESTETAYPVGLRPAIFSHLAESLTPIFVKKRNEAIADNKEAEFYQSRLAILMHQITEQFEKPDTLPKKPVVVLSRQDIDMVEDEVPTRTDAAGRMIRAEWINELKGDFQSAELRENTKRFGRNAASMIKKVIKPQ